jgi:23S rRNA (adenine1618-N6)-methyltransferase
MPIQLKQTKNEKTNLHSRNPHRDQYDFPLLIRGTPELGSFVSLNKFRDLSIDFKDSEAVKALNKALLKQFYKIDHWDIPNGYLCPPIPGRADYLHYAADIFSSFNSGIIPFGKRIKVLDIGTGANCIYPLIGYKTYGWCFVGADIDKKAIQSAQNCIDANKLADGIELRIQNDPSNMFTGIIKPDDFFDLTICNPPFHASLKEAAAGTQRKWKNLGHEDKKTPVLNFGGQNRELWCEGGEQQFVNKMISESVRFAKQCLWFSSLVSKRATLAGAYKALEKAGAAEVQTIGMSQGQKTSRILAWTFMDKAAQDEWRAGRWR